jgi:cytochrome c2
VLVLFITMMQSGALGALLTLSKRVWFPIHAAGEAALNVLPIDDQQLAGLIMWVVGSLLYLAAMSILLFAWLRQNERHRRAAALVILAAFATSGCRRAEGSVIPGGSINRGRQSLVVMGCGNCHEIAGVLGAHGRVGPPLTGIASRSIIAGHLPNTPENMMRWIMDPPSVDSLTAMPNLGVAEQTARDISAYLYTLR